MWRPTLVIALIASLAAVTQVRGQASQRARSPEHDVLQVDDAIQAAVLAADIAALDRHWSDDVMFIGGDGRVWNKVERLNDFQSRDRKVGAQRTEARTVRVYGETAIVAFSGWQQGVRDGRAFNSRSYLTRVYLKRGGRWQMVHQHSALLERAR